jgi:AmmeMemoRadiSam system protein B
MRTTFLFLFPVLFIGAFLSCKQPVSQASERIRPLKDTIGFAQYTWQMDSLMSRIERAGWKKGDTTSLRFAICPHDDYTYVGKLYPELLQNIKAPNVILLGVAHGAAKMGIEDSLVFDSFTEWKGPWNYVKILPEREDIYEALAGKYAIVNDSLHTSEHSIEAMIPFLQYFNRDVSIIPILVPAMSPRRMEQCGRALAQVIDSVAAKNKWEWGKDYAIVVTTDAVHYGNEDWGGKDMAPFGCDTTGIRKALNLEHRIINWCFRGDINPWRIRMFNRYTLDQEDYHNYKWTWCGRYCVPVAMYAAYYLDHQHTLQSMPAMYSTSITASHVPVDDLRMGRTAIATRCHWVGYAAVGYR